MPKRYYWLKLKSDFFSSKRIKKLRNMAGGDTYTIIYLKMQLLAMKTDGVLTWTGLEDNFADELALDIDERSEDVEVTLLYLLKTGLAETQDNKTFFFPYAIENTGSETAGAQRNREYRARQLSQRDAQLSLCDAGVTPWRCGRDVEIEKDTEKELEQEQEQERDTETDDGFEAFWAAYPKKSGDIRQAYFEYLGAIQSGATPDALMAAVAWQKEQKEQRYFPAAEKWLRNRGWTERPEAGGSAKKKVTTFMDIGEAERGRANDG